MANPLCLFSVFSNINVFYTSKCDKWSIYSNPRPLGHESPLVTTRSVPLRERLLRHKEESENWLANVIYVHKKEWDWYKDRKVGNRKRSIERKE